MIDLIIILVFNTKYFFTDILLFIKIFYRQVISVCGLLRFWPSSDFSFNFYNSTLLLYFSLSDLL